MRFSLEWRERASRNANPGPFTTDDPYSCGMVNAIDDIGHHDARCPHGLKRTIVSGADQAHLNASMAAALPLAAAHIPSAIRVADAPSLVHRLFRGQNEPVTRERYDRTHHNNYERDHGGVVSAMRSIIQPVFESGVAAAARGVDSITAAFPAASDAIAHGVARVMGDDAQYHRVHAPDYVPFMRAVPPPPLVGVEPNPGPPKSGIKKAAKRVLREERKIAQGAVARAMGSKVAKEVAREEKRMVLAPRGVARRLGAQRRIALPGAKPAKQLRAAMRAPRGSSQLAARREFIDPGTGDAIIAGSDYLAPVVLDNVNTTGGVLYEYNCNPEQASTVALRQFAQLYQKFEYLEVGIEFRSSEAFTYGGSINCLWDSDVGDSDGSGLDLVKQAATTPEARETSILQSHTWWYNAKAQAGGSYFIHEDDATKAGQRQTIQAHAKIFVVNPVNNAGVVLTAGTIGSFIVHYRVRFVHRQIDVIRAISTDAAWYFTNPDNTHITGVDDFWNGPHTAIYGPRDPVKVNDSTTIGVGTGNATTITFNFQTSGMFLISGGFSWQTVTASPSSASSGLSFDWTFSGCNLVSLSGNQQLIAIVADNVASGSAANNFTAVGGFIVLNVTSPPASVTARVYAVGTAYTLSAGAGSNRCQFQIITVPIRVPWSSGGTVGSTLSKSPADLEARIRRVEEQAAHDRKRAVVLLDDDDDNKHQDFARARALERIRTQFVESVKVPEETRAPARSSSQGPPVRGPVVTPRPM
jgi:hypothetical protein